MSRVHALNGMIVLDYRGVAIGGIAQIQERPLRSADLTKSKGLCPDATDLNVAQNSHPTDNPHEDSQLDEIMNTPTTLAAELPTFGTFYSAQFWGIWAPLPANVLERPCWSLGDGVYLLDDLEVDYDLYLPESGGNELESSLMLSSLASYESSAIHLTNFSVTIAGLSRTASFAIAGGCTNLPYDILTSTNLTHWEWGGLGYTAHTYAFSNQPSAKSFYTVARPESTLVLGLGTNDVGQCDVPFGLTNAVQAAAGRSHSTALLSDGTVVAWGNNDFDQTEVPTNLAPCSMVAAGWYHSVALLTNGGVVAWGLNSPLYQVIDVPDDLTNATVISAQGLQNLALTRDGRVVAWGQTPSVPAHVTNIVAISAGIEHNLAVRSNGTVVSWGSQTNVPAGITNILDVAAGYTHSLALRADGTVVAWGSNTHGETNVPAGLSDVVAIAAGADAEKGTGYSLALASDGTITMWGAGEVLCGSSAISNVFGIAAGRKHALAVRTGPRSLFLALQPTDQYQVPGGEVKFTSRGCA